MLKDLIISIFGVYDPVTYEVPHYAADGTLLYTDSIIGNGFSGVDWPYILGVLAFLVVLYCVLRIIGSVIKSV